MSTHFLSHDTARPCTEYHFDRPGDGLPMHQHGKDQEHDVLCVQGRVSVVHTTGAALLKAGERAVFDSTRFHTVIALEPDSVVLNTYLNGPPDGFKPGEVGEYDIYRM
jgi:hypothetical protein